MNRRVVAGLHSIMTGSLLSQTDLWLSTEERTENEAHYIHKLYDINFGVEIWNHKLVWWDVLTPHSRFSSPFSTNQVCSMKHLWLCLTFVPVRSTWERGLRWPGRSRCQQRTGPNIRIQRGGWSTSHTSNKSSSKGHVELWNYLLLNDSLLVRNIQKHLSFICLAAKIFRF